MTASTPRSVPSASRDDRDAAAAVGDHDEAGVDQRAARPGASTISQRLGRGDDAAPALLAAVLPGLAVLDEHRGLVGRQVAADRLGRAGEARRRRRRRGCG